MQGFSCEDGMRDCLCILGLQQFTGECYKGGLHGVPLTFGPQVQDLNRPCETCDTDFTDCERESRLLLRGRMQNGRRSPPNRSPGSNPPQPNDLDGQFSVATSGCTCGSAHQLEEECQRLAAQSYSLATRLDSVVAREEDMDHCLESLDLDIERIMVALYNTS